MTADQNHDYTAEQLAFDAGLMDLFPLKTSSGGKIRFIEDNWLAGERIGQRSFDGIANPITQMFNFKNIRRNGVLFLNPSTGERECCERIHQLHRGCESLSHPLSLFVVRQFYLGNLKLIVTCV